MLPQKHINMQIIYSYMYIVYNGKTHLLPFFLTFCLKKNVISNHSVITVENRYLYTKFVMKNPENVLVI